ncbi:hypothetical protein E2C01_003752 [Portunus trituberculatus]|uniref:Uncharacterized protein n=1 Tax=Portunus trituberculatus TaxID=210409 RepID=A0A5B7CNT5_PORTR|nr:hypothetical protein [Portunus trituberculatus]
MNSASRNRRRESGAVEEPRVGGRCVILYDSGVRSGSKLNLDWSGTGGAGPWQLNSHWHSRSALAPVKISFEGTVTGVNQSKSASVNASTEINETILDRTESRARPDR